MFPRHQLRLLLLSVAVVTVSTQPVFLVGAAFFQIGPEFGIGPVGLGALTAAFFLASSVSSPFLGRWVQAVGWRRAMRLNLIVSGSLMVSCAWLASSAMALSAFLVAGALVYGMSNPAANQSLATHTDPARAATVFGLKHAGIPSSTLLAGLAVPAIIVHFGWRASFMVSGLLAWAVLFLIPRTEARAPEQFAAAPIRGRPLGGSGLAGLALAAALGAVAASALGTYLVSAAVDLGFTESAAGTLQFAGSGASIAARVMTGAVFDRRMAAGFTGLMLMMGLGSVAFSVLPITIGASFVMVVIVAYATGWGWPGLMTYTVVDADRAAAASSSSMVQAGVFVGAGGGPLAIGFAVEQWGYDAAWFLTAGSLLAATVTVLWTYRRAYARGP